MIQIKETCARKAALEIADVMDAQGGEWIVNAIDDEGYIMARVGSRYAGMLERSGSPSLAGPFNARWKVLFIANDLQEAKGAGNVKLARKVETASRRMYRSKTNRRSRNTVMMHVAMVLAKQPLSTDALAEKVGVDEQAIRNALRRLVHTGRVQRGRKVADQRRGGVRWLYEALA